MSFLRCKFFRASGEAILGTLKYFSQTSLDDGFQKDLGASEPNEENRPEVKTPNPARRRFKKKEELKELKDCTFISWLKIFRASGEAIWGTQRYFSKIFPKRL